MSPRDIKQDLRKLADAFFDELCMLEVEYGGIGLDPKRPFGNSNVERDILELLDCEPEDDGDHSQEQREYAEDLYRNKLIPYLQAKWKEVP